MMETVRPPLAGERVLIVEDRYLIASELADQVTRLGGEVVGPVRNVTAAAELLARQTVQIALLDVNLEGEMVFPLAEALADQGVPIIFLTGYDEEVLPPPWRERPHISKPVDPTRLRAVLDTLARA